MTLTIERVEVLCLQDPQAAYYRFEGSYRNVVVQVHGNNGLVGIGESDAPPEIVKAMIEMQPYNQRSEGLADIVTGQAVDDPCRLWDEMYARTQWYGRRGAALHAISALDIAIWDLFAQSKGVPVSEALGGAHHDRLPAYATIYPLEDTPARIDAQVSPLLERGFRHLKVCVEPWWSEPNRVRRNLSHLRDLVGSERGLMLDVAQEYSQFDQLAPFLDLLAELDFAWIEAPFPLDAVEEHAKLRTATRIPIGVGDLGLTTCREFEPFVAEDAFDIAQPDLTMFGGFTEALRLAQMLDGTGRRIVPHAYNTDITIAANLHFLATQPEMELVECSTSPSRLRQGLVRGLAPIDVDGTIPVPTGPGLGVTLNADAVGEFALNRAVEACR
ncbi:MAG: mandelate racemase/muconate lactonizing enzyme family protein [Gammaproteobacteria bacterium]|nr:mandelate racemase/muconate lactonizing enzyme family protein [Gammaproteobacteria bacterium]